MATSVSAIDTPASAASLPDGEAPALLSYVRELSRKPLPLKTTLIGASVAMTAAVVVVVAIRARSHRARRAVPDTSSGVVGVILKSALFAALQTVVKVKAERLAAKALHLGHEAEPSADVPGIAP